MSNRNMRAGLTRFFGTAFFPASVLFVGVILTSVANGQAAVSVEESLPGAESSVKFAEDYQAGFRGKTPRSNKTPRAATRGDSRSDSRGGVSSSASVAYLDAIKEKLSGMKRNNSAKHDNDKLDAENDWFVVGGTIKDSRTGRILDGTITALQGVDLVAEKIVVYENQGSESQLADWRVFERYGDGEVAEKKADTLHQRFVRYQNAQTRTRQRSQNQTPNRSRSSSGSRGSC